MLTQIGQQKKKKRRRLPLRKGRQKQHKLKGIALQYFYFLFLELQQKVNMYSRCYLSKSWLLIPVLEKKKNCCQVSPK